MTPIAGGAVTGSLGGGGGGGGFAGSGAVEQATNAKANSSTNSWGSVFMMVVLDAPKVRMIDPSNGYGLLLVSSCYSMSSFLIETL